MERNGFPEETYYTFSYSPIPTDDGSPGGIFCANTDDTQRVISERQLSLLRDLASSAAQSRTVAQACESSAKALSTDPRDLPFALIYLVEPGGASVRLAASAGIDADHPGVKPVLSLAGGAEIWPLAEALQCERAAAGARSVATVSGLHFPTGGWRQPPSQAIVLPIQSSGDTGRVRLSDRRPQSVPAVRRRLSRLPRPGRRPDRRGDHQRRRLRGGAPARRSAGRDRPRQDRVLLQRQPRIPHPADADAGPARGGVRPGRSCPHEQQRAARHRPPQRAAAAEARQHPARLRADRGRPRHRALHAGRPVVVHRRARLQLPLGDRQGRPAAGDRRAAAAAAGLCRSRHVGEDRSSTCSPTPSSSPSRARSASSSAPPPTAAPPRSWCATPAPASRPPRSRICSSASTASKARAAGRSRAAASAWRWCRSWSSCTAAASASRASSAAAAPFAITLPFGTAHLPAERPAASAPLQVSTNVRAQAYLDEALGWLQGDGGGRPPDRVLRRGSRARRDPQRRGDRPRILLADDNADMRDYVARLLGEATRSKPSATASPRWKRRGSAGRIW